MSISVKDRSAAVVADGLQQGLSTRAELLAWVAGLGAASAESVARCNGVSLASARARLQHCVKLGFLTRSDVLAGRPALYAATAKGLKAVGLTALRRCEPRASNAEHLIACSNVAAGLARFAGGYELMGECCLRALERERRERVASALLAYDADGEQHWHRPDLVLWRRDGGCLPIAVEVELTLKGHDRLAKICKAWARNGLVGGVIYATSASADAGVRAAVRRACAEGKVVVVALDVFEAM